MDFGSRSGDSEQGWKEEHHREAGEGTRVPVLVRRILLPPQTWTLVILHQQEARRRVTLLPGHWGSITAREVLQPQVSFFTVADCLELELCLRVGFPQRGQRAVGSDLCSCLCSQ